MFSNCAVSGTLITDVNGTDTVSTAQLTIGKDSISGMGKADDGTAFLFTAVKR